MISIPRLKQCRMANEDQVNIVFVIEVHAQIDTHFDEVMTFCHQLVYHLVVLLMMVLMVMVMMLLLLLSLLRSR
jgi:hypothetical protein